MTAAMTQRIQIIDSHTGGEPTRVVIDGFPDLGTGTMAERRERLTREHDRYRRATLLEPRGSEVLVGALLCPPHAAPRAGGVAFVGARQQCHVARTVGRRQRCEQAQRQQQRRRHTDGAEALPEAQALPPRRPRFRHLARRQPVVQRQRHARPHRGGRLGGRRVGAERKQAVLPGVDGGPQCGVLRQCGGHGGVVLGAQRAEHVLAGRGVALDGVVQPHHARHSFRLARLRLIHDLTVPSGVFNRAAICSCV
jgi:hypothetical protein